MNKMEALGFLLLYNLILGLELMGLQGVLAEPLLLLFLINSRRRKQNIF